MLRAVYFGINWLLEPKKSMRTQTGNNLRGALNQQLHFELSTKEVHFEEWQIVLDLALGLLFLRREAMDDGFCYLNSKAWMFNTAHLKNTEL